MIRTLDQLAELVGTSGRIFRIAIAKAEDSNSINAINRAVSDGFAEALLIGDADAIRATCSKNKIDPDRFEILDTPGEYDALDRAVRMVREGDADILMKGLVGTGSFLKAVMNKEHGLMLPGAVLSYVCAIQIPSYRKLLFVTDTAVIPFPDLNQKIAMADYALAMARRFGIVNPRIALVSATEKPGSHFSSSADYSEMLRLAAEGRFGDCTMDGPVDIFLACDPASPAIKGVNTPLAGEADILLFPSLESSNPFYKGLMLFAGGELAGMITGTEKPVVVMSRSESEQSKYYCIALSCLMASK